MSDSTTLVIPSYVSGIPNNFDTVPAIICISLYALLLPLSAIRLFKPKTRNVVQLSFTAQVIEKITCYVCRLLQGINYASWTSRSLSVSILEYQMVSQAWGWIAVAQASSQLLRSLMVNATRPLSTPPESPPREDWTKDLKGERRFSNRLYWTLNTFYWIANLLGVASALAWREIIDGRHINRMIKVQNATRYTSIILAMVLTAMDVFVALRVRKTMARIDKKACMFLVYMWLFILIVPIYRLTQYPLCSSISVASDGPSLSHILNPLPIAGGQEDTDVPDGSTDYTSTLPTSSPRAKVFFYLFHFLPEYISVAIFLAIDTRSKFNTGAWGDPRWSWRKGWIGKFHDVVYEKVIRRSSLVTHDKSMLEKGDYPKSFGKLSEKNRSSSSLSLSDEEFSLHLTESGTKATLKSPRLSNSFSGPSRKEPRTMAARNLHLPSLSAFPMKSSMDGNSKTAVDSLPQTRPQSPKSSPNQYPGSRDSAGISQSQAPLIREEPKFKFFSGFNNR